MARHRRLPTLTGQLWRALTRTLTLTAAASFLVIGGTGAAYVVERSEGPPAGVDGLGVVTRTPEARLMERYDCSLQGYGDEATPRSALVRAADGRLRVVTFEQGWRVHTSGGEAKLVAVCLRPPR